MTLFYDRGNSLEKILHGSMDFRYLLGACVQLVYQKLIICFERLVFE
eukprot:XP_001709552.1 Hypothetical protein GL50803_99322 [Giardia lamblia ATCC 50803]